ncbi:hypothetical protein EZ428_17095 [Pedobacter frigiditerrae]|uniref:DoxX family protein n=1 Tax=Pedobacter frigiditerrae TaxID=2530452 RepID=A0A4R0MR61_9SPHI|nr:hypothetical protein [Pedobacter frigiditerrae]TCC89411.1 hypothetical protein EZ428_17095 [Pedobacter frigiditerrae]
MEKHSENSKPWLISKRFFTLLSIYFAFLMVDFTSSDELFPHFVYVLMTPYTEFWHWIVPWFGEHVLHLSYPITVKPNGSGDTTYNYVLQLLWIIFALIITTVWTILDRKRPSYYQFQYWSRIVIRYFLAYMLFVYGFVKVIKLQFPFPDLIRLTEPYGDSTPMGLAWTFVGYSSGYNLFTGGAEVLAGILLFYKRTTLFGSLVAMTVMANVVAMNFAYDIPVKIFSLNLLIMAVWIAWYDKDRLINFFFLNKVTAPSVIEYPYHTKWKKIVQLSLKSIAILFALYSTLYSNLNTAKEYGDAAPKPPLYGIYDVKTFSLKGELLAPLTTDSTRWKRMIIGYPGYVRITKMTDSNVWMKLKVDTNAKTLKLTSTKDSTNQYNLGYKKLGKDQVIVKGLMGKDSVSIQFKQFDHTQFNLVKTGFHWINEYPNNR